ncbi:MAG: hypothetical protein EOP16_00585 [Pseudonocardia sp.]|nr:MAG: hypothetical protein EOP16_00585 [Pseudonocardia sp.]
MEVRNPDSGELLIEVREVGHDADADRVLGSAADGPGVCRVLSEWLVEVVRQASAPDVAEAIGHGEKGGTTSGLPIEHGDVRGDAGVTRRRNAAP